MLVSTIAVFVFLFAVYRLPDERRRCTFADVLPGAIVATVVLEATFQVLPIYLGYSKQRRSRCRRSAARRSCSSGST